MTIEFASVHEVWGEPFGTGASDAPPTKNKKKARLAKEPTCAPFQQKVPDIMSAYLDDFMGPLAKQSAPVERNHSRANSAERNTMEAAVDVFPLDQFYEFENAKAQSRRKVYPSQQQCDSGIPEGLTTSSLTETSMEYNDYYDSQPKRRTRQDGMMSGMPIIESVPVFEPFQEADADIDEDDEHVVAQYPVRRSPSGYAYPQLEPLQPFQPPSSKQMYMEFFLYVFSGIILIFILEQVLQMGMKMRGI